ncbi:MAG TPA: GAF domain-containing protein [Gemmatimonadaceae bacterium]|jgi:PAS domain S-box-containing protein|nr:GAF domain-containing protein [Gemmatimonadaceae bacterium]
MPSIDSLFEALAASAPDAILAIDSASTMLFANPAVLRVFGYMPEELIGRPLSMLIPERLRGSHDVGLARYLSTGRRNIPWTGIELSALRRDGSEIPVEISFGEFVDRTGNRNFSGFVRDVSERVRQQRELEEARATAERALNELARVGRITDAAIAQTTYDEMLRQLLEHLRRELESDDASLLLLDYRMNDLALRASTDELLDPHAGVRVPLGKGVTGGVAASGKPVIIDDLASVDVVSARLHREFKSLVAVPVRGAGQVIGVLMVASHAARQFTEADLRLLQIVADRMAGVLARTRLFEAEAAARRDEETLRLLAQSITGAVRIHEVMHQISEGALAVSGASGAYVEQVVSASAAVELVAAAGENVPPVGQRVAYPGSLTEEIIERREPVFLVRTEGIGVAMAPYLARHCAGCSVLVVPLLADHEVLGALVLMRKADEPAFEVGVINRVRTLSDLASIALQRLVALAESERRRSEAEAAVRSRDEVLSVVSHDLRNPVSTVSMSASLLADPEIILSDDDRRKQIEVIARSAQRMNRLIQDLLDVARIEGGRFTISCKCEDCGALAAEACEAFRSVATQKSISLECRCDDRLPRVLVDRDRILQVLSNYLNNALKFTPAGGRVTIAAARTKDDGARFSVSDTGSGIATTDLPNVFNRFWQAKGTAHLGSGLGLAIAKGIAEAHRGRVGVDSSVGDGSTFWLELPRSQECL